MMKLLATLVLAMAALSSAFVVPASTVVRSSGPARSTSALSMNAGADFMQVASSVFTAVVEEGENYGSVDAPGWVLPVGEFQ